MAGLIWLSRDAIGQGTEVIGKLLFIDRKQVQLTSVIIRKTESLLPISLSSNV